MKPIQYCFSGKIPATAQKNLPRSSLLRAHKNEFAEPLNALKAITNPQEEDIKGCSPLVNKYNELKTTLLQNVY